MKYMVVAVLALSVLTPSAWAAEIVLDGNRPTRVGMVADDILSRMAPGMRFHASVGALDATEVRTPRGTFTRLSIPGYQHSGVEGAPALPVMNTLVEVPFGGAVEVKVLTSNVQRYNLVDLGITSRIAPRQPSQPKSSPRLPFRFEQSAYMAEGFQQDELASIEEVGVMRHVRLALLKIAPVAYSPTEGTLEVYNDIEVEITVQNPDLRQTAEVKRKYATPVFGGVYKHILSPTSLRALNTRAADRAVRYVIVSDPMFKNDLAEFIAWKTQKGFDVKVAYTDEIGATTDAVKGFIAAEYNGATPPDFVLFVGDNDQIPAFKGTTGSHISELYFVAVTPGDKIPDILTGRFSARNSAELIPQLEKTLQYEKYQMPDPSFLTNTVMIAGWDSRFTFGWGWPQIKYGLQYYFNAAHGMPNQKTFLSSGSGQNVPQIHAAVGAGTGYVNYTAHGSSTSWADPSFTKTDIDALKNEGKYPLMVGNCCLTSKFEIGACFAEMLVRAPKKGALGYIGGTNSTYWDEDLWWGVGFYPIVNPNPQGIPPVKEKTGQGAYDAVFEGGFDTMAGMILAGNLAVEASSSPRKLYYWEVYQLMGDPSLKVYFGLPSVASVEHASEVRASEGTLEIKAPAGSYVGVTVDGTLLAGGFASEDGRATLAMTDLCAGTTGTVVVTGKSLQPYTGTFAVVE